jgi:hypothetical protein
VLAHVRDGAVTVEAAQRDDGVVVTGGKGSWAIDAQATRAARADAGAKVATNGFPSWQSSWCVPTWT